MLSQLSEYAATMAHNEKESAFDCRRVHMTTEDHYPSEDKTGCNNADTSGARDALTHNYEADPPFA